MENKFPLNTQPTNIQPSFTNNYINSLPFIPPLTQAPSDPYNNIYSTHSNISSTSFPNNLIYYSNTFAPAPESTFSHNSIIPNLSIPNSSNFNNRQQANSFYYYV